MATGQKVLQRLVAGICAGIASTGWCADEPAQQLKEVVVTSTTIDDRFASKRDEPSTVSEISGKQVDSAHIQNISEVLNSIPGVTADLSSGDEIKIKLRGIENQRYMGEKPGVAIVIDGVPVFERTGKVNIDLDNIESIKVVKGGASYLFGEDALAGAVIITTKRGAKYAGVTAGAEVGEWDYNKQLARVGFAGDKGTGHVQVSRRYGDDYYFQSAYETNYLDGNVRLYLSDTSDLTFGFEKSDRMKDKHGSVKGVTQAEIDPRGILGRDYSRKYDVGLQKLNLTYANDYAPNSNILLTGYEYRDQTTFWTAPQAALLSGAAITPADPNYYSAYQTINNWDQVQRGAKGEWRSGIGNVGWLAGVDLRRNTYDQLNRAGVDYCKRVMGVCTAANRILAGTVMTDDTTEENINALYGELKFKPTTDWTLTLNSRYDHLELDYQARPGSENLQTSFSKSKSFDVNSWRAGANYAVGPTMDVYGNLSTGFRTPSVDQLYRGSISPSSGKTASNENLRPEESINMELGLRTRTEWFGVAMDVEGAVFQIDRQDFILATTGQYGGSSTTAVERYDNIGGVRNRGFELALRSDRRREFAFDAAYTFIDAYFTQYDNYNLMLGNIYGSANGTAPCTVTFNPANCYRLVSTNNTGNLVPRVPKHMLNLTGYWQPTNQFRLSLEMDAKSWSYADEINQEKWAGRTLFNLLANYDVTEKGFMGAKWSFFARVNNLFDRKYWQAARGSNDSKGNFTTSVYDGVYNAEDLSIIVGKPRNWSAGVSATF